jgi:cytosine deaminase
MSMRGTADIERVLADVRLADGTPVDLLLRGEHIAAVGPGLAAGGPHAQRIDGQGHVVLPALVDGHVHLDKTLTGMPWMPHPAGPTRASRIETEASLRASLPPVAERAANLVRCAIAHGTTAIRSHADVDPDIGLSHVHALLEVRERFGAQVRIQIVAFPQRGVACLPGMADLLDAAVTDGADLVGGIDPITFDGTPGAQYDALFAVASRHDCGVDVHLHDAGADGLAEITALAEYAIRHGLEGRVSVSHGFSLGAAGDDDFVRVADRMAAARLSLVTHGGAASPLPPVKRLRELGVEVFAGNDDVRDPWSPFGNGDMLQRAMLLAWRSGFRTDDDLAIAFDCASAAGARVLGLDRHGLAPGCRADLFTVPAQTLAEAVAQCPPRALVLHGARVVPA